ARSLSQTFSAKKKIMLVPMTANGGFRLKSPENKIAERKYPGSLEVSRVNGALLLIDKIPIEEYTAGVVQAEAGRDHHIEYYKLQSVSCRTFALSNIRKHTSEGFQLCDGVHCQAFHGKAWHDSIYMAVEATRNLVLVNSHIELIHSTFHSNCGGETVNAEDCWSKSESYLRAIKDTFCLLSPHSNWNRTLSRSEWLGYLQKRYSVNLLDTVQLEAISNYEPTCRDLYLGNTWPLVPLKFVRQDLKLNSTFFSVKTTGEEVQLTGRGFGHGVGLCQEGSMKMARSGRSYVDILHHYYTDVHLVDLSALAFFKD
ncbi:MAG: SpoIID/LytB domain-containing protein, partial [Bacteroidota bacterium]|nr:SpoIID/LytB domain-containing protein [Bacteroidota bacterium]